MAVAPDDRRLGDRAMAPWRRIGVLALSGLSLHCSGAGKEPVGGIAAPVKPAEDARECAREARGMLDQAMALNRRGDWAQAERVAAGCVASGCCATAILRCEAHYGVAYAQLRLGHDDGVVDVLGRYDRECGDFERHWTAAEVLALRRELARPKPAPGAERDGFWRTATPGEVGVDPAVAADHEALCRDSGAGACLMVRGRRIFQEWYREGFELPAYAMSSTKSITGLLVGMLIDDGRIPGVEQRVCDYLADWCTGRRGEVTIHHLLSMTSGLKRLRESGVGYELDKNPYVVALTPDHEPGTTWAYSNEGVQLLSPILDRAALMPIQDYARARLFAQLGMHDTELNLDSQGHAWTYADMRTTPRDLARIGLLMLQGGEWEGQRIVSRPWIVRSVAPSQAMNPQYGLLWWLHPGPRGFAAHGYLDTNLYVFPDRDLVVVRMQAKPTPGATPYEPGASKIWWRVPPLAE